MHKQKQTDTNRDKQIQTETDRDQETKISNIGNKDQQQSRAKTSSDKLRPTETRRNNTDNKEEQQSRANEKQGQTETNRDKEGPRETTHTTKKGNGDMCMSQLGCLASKLVGMENIVRSDTLMYP